MTSILGIWKVSLWSGKRGSDSRHRAATPSIVQPVWYNGQSFPKSPSLPKVAWRCLSGILHREGADLPSSPSLPYRHSTRARGIMGREGDFVFGISSGKKILLSYTHSFACTSYSDCKTSMPRHIVLHMIPCNP